MQPLVSAAQMREIDKRTVSDFGFPELLLMEHAALAVVEALKKRYGSSLLLSSGVILAGTGNNGGDALAVARLLSSLGMQRLFVGVIGSETSLSLSATIQLKLLGKLGVPVYWPKGVDTELLKDCDWIVDGMFGTGLTRDVEEPYLHWIAKLNEVAVRKWIVAIDLPSGLSSDTGHRLGDAVKASETVSLGFIKKGLVTARAADYVGHLSLASIQIPRLIPFPVDAFLYGMEDAARLPERKPTSHKGSFGHVYVWASEKEKQGACILSCLGALRSGAGLVTVLGKAEILNALRSQLPPEVMTQTYAPNLFASLSAKNSERGGVLVIGPGMGTGSANGSFEFQWEIFNEVYQSALAANWKCVVDADALTLISQNVKDSKTRNVFKKNINGQNTVFTPHPKEASRLLGLTVEEIEADRFLAVAKLAELLGATTLLKGKGSLVQVPKHPCIAVQAGDTGLSKGGTGDLLTGILAAQLAVGLPMEQAIPLGVFVHGKVSERVTQIFGHERSTLPTDLAIHLCEVYAELAQWNKRASPGKTLNE